jgi:hypothetical protein
MPAALMPSLAILSPVNRACKEMKSHCFLFTRILSGLHALECSHFVVFS